MENAGKLVKIIRGEMTGEAAASALREALIDIQAVDTGLTEWRRLVSVAEAMLIYGLQGRPSALASCWSINPKEFAELERKDFDVSKVLFSALVRKSEFMSWAEVRLTLSKWLETADQCHSMGVSAPMTPELLRAFSSLLDI